VARYPHCYLSLKPLDKQWQNPQAFVTWFFIILSSTCNSSISIVAVASVGELIPRSWLEEFRGMGHCRDRSCRFLHLMVFFQCQIGLIILKAYSIYFNLAVHCASNSSRGVKTFEDRLQRCQKTKLLRSSSAQLLYLPGEYGGALKRAIAALKYENQPQIAGPLAY